MIDLYVNDNAGYQQIYTDIDYAKITTLGENVVLILIKGGQNFILDYNEIESYQVKRHENE